MGEKYSLDTLCVHGGYEPDSQFHSMAPPIYLTNAYDLVNAEHARQLFALETEGDIYSRISNPTNSDFEKRMALLEGGVAAVSFSSGHAAIFGIMATLCSTGDEIVSSSAIYGGAVAMFTHTLKNFGITVRFVDVNDPAAFAAATNEKTRAWFVEMVGNPTAAVADIGMISALAKKAGVPLVVDSTFTPPTLFRPLDHGADIVVHSATKYICGNGTAMGGIVIDGGHFEYLNNPRFPKLNCPDPAYHDLVFAKEFGTSAFITRLRSNTLRDIGACASPFNSFLMTLGLETLHLRMARHCANATAVAEMLSTHKNVETVSYPLLPGSKYFSLAQKYLSNGCGSVFSFELAGGREAGVKFSENLTFIKNVANLGDVRTIVVQPATTSHSQLSPNQLKAAGVTESMIRISVGIEGIEDILSDIRRALDKI